MLNLEKASAFRPRRRRRRSLAAPVDVPLTPCRSTNRLPFVRRLTRRPEPTTGSLWSAVTGTTAAADDEREEDGELGDLAAAETDREGGAPSGASCTCDAEAQLLRMGARKWGTSSHGSCAAWSATSLAENCPVSPPPVCSPHHRSPPTDTAAAGVGYRVCKSPGPTHSNDIFYSQVSDLHSSAPRFQSSGGINARKSTSRLESRSGGKRRSNVRASMSRRKSFLLASTPSPGHVKPGRRSGVGAVLELDKPGNYPRRSVTLAGASRFSTCSRRSARNNSFIDDEEHHRHLSVLGEEDEELDERGWRKLNPFNLGSAPPVRRKSHHRCHGCSPSDDCKVQSGFVNDGVSNTYDAWVEGRVDAQTSRMSDLARQTGRSKLLEWKETRTKKVLDDLKKKEAEITDWETRETSKAKKEMKKVEEEMEKKRSRAMDRMQRKVVEAQRRGEQRKCQARQSAVKKMAKLEKACDKAGTTTRFPWNFFS